LLGRASEEGVDPATGRMDARWYILHTAHDQRLTEEEVSLNCRLRLAVLSSLCNIPDPRPSTLNP
jgi:hypothetical protein